MTKLVLTFLLLLTAAAGAAEKKQAFKPESLAPAYLPFGRPAQAELTESLRARVRTLGLNGLPASPDVKGAARAKALLLLPRDRAGAGVLSFEIEGGKKAGVYQCEALGRGQTADGPKPRWLPGLIGGSTVYYAPKEIAGGATVPGVYDLRNISPERYEIAFLDKPEDLAGEEEVAALSRSRKSGAKPFFSAVWKHWYSKGSTALPVDMLWAVDSQAGTQGEGVPVFELPPQASAQEAVSLRIKQLLHNPRYYNGPYGRYGFAVHTDRWEDPARAADPAFSGRKELTDFRRRDTDGCVKLRPGCLELLNEFISGQEKLGRRVQLEVYETALLDDLPAEAPAKQGSPENAVSPGPQ